jgi:8-oxo-dGTP pyrophosphatase MutT (NUDIX family)
VPTLKSTHVEVYLFRRHRRRVEFLALRRASRRRFLPGVWQPVTGKRDPGETVLRAAVREVLEETGLEPRRWWVLETLTVYFDGESESIMVLPLFAAEVDARRRVRLSAEHDAHRFLPAAQAGRRFLWESQRRALDAIRREILAGGPRARALEITHRLTSPRGVARRKGARRGDALGSR